jgi:hypothetical protein
LLPVVYSAFEGKGDARKREMHFAPAESSQHAGVAS